MIELIAVHEPETKMIPNYSNRMIGTYEQRSEPKKPIIPHVPLSKLEIPYPEYPEKPSLIKRILKWFKK